MSNCETLFTPRNTEPAVLQIHAPGESGWLTADEVAALTPEIVRQRIRDLRPMIARYAPEAERLGRPHPEVWEALRATGFFYHFVPKVYGGCEFDPEDFFVTTAAIAEACASTAWAAAFSVEHNWIAALYPKKAQDDFFANGRYMVAPAVSVPLGKAVRVPGGYRLTAHWKYGSGSMYADWCIGNALIEGDENPMPHWFAFPMNQAKVLDTWQVDGLLATGSNDIVVDDIFVPEHMALNFVEIQSGISEGAKIHPNPLYRMPSLGFLAMVVSAPIIGAARGAVEIFRERLKTRVVTGTTSILGEKSHAQITLARADLMVRTAEMLMRQLSRDVLDLARQSQCHDVPNRCGIVAHNIYAARQARDAVRLIVDNSGSSVHFLKDPMQRILRDVNAASSHLIQDFENIAEQHGRFMLGMQPTAFFY